MEQLAGCVVMQQGFQVRATFIQDCSIEAQQHIMLGKLSHLLCSNLGINKEEWTQDGKHADRPILLSGGARVTRRAICLHHKCKHTSLGEMYSGNAMNDRVMYAV